MGGGVHNGVALQMITTAAMRAGFSGGLVVDFPNSSKAKKFYLVLMVGQPSEPVQLQGLTGEEGRGGVDVVRDSAPALAPHGHRAPATLPFGCQSAHRNGSKLKLRAALRDESSSSALSAFIFS